MYSFFELSYALIVVFVIIQSLVLFSIVRRIAMFKKLYPDSEVNIEDEFLNSKVSLSILMPSFSSQDELTGKVIISKDIKNFESMFIFLSEDNVDHINPEELKNLIQSMYERTDSPTYIIFSGSKKKCTKFSGLFKLRENFENDIILLLDKDNGLSNEFNVTHPPCAILYDENHLLQKFGEIAPK